MVDTAALLGILESEKESYRSLLELSKRKQDLIINGDIEGLSDVVRQTERIMLNVCDLEEKRLALIGASTGNDSSHVPPELSTMLGGLDKQTIDKALRLKDEILSIIGELAEVNKTNAELLKRNLNYTSFMLSAIMPDENPMYSNKSNPQGSALRLFDGRA